MRANNPIFAKTDRKCKERQPARTDVFKGLLVAHSAFCQLPAIGTAPFFVLADEIQHLAKWRVVNLINNLSVHAINNVVTAENAHEIGLNMRSDFPFKVYL